MTKQNIWNLHVSVHFTSATMRFSLPLFLSALAAGASASNVLDLGPDNFDNVIGKGKPALVEL
jgi:hypothetical protein